MGAGELFMNKKFLIILIIIVFIVVFSVLRWQKLVIITDKKEYQSGENLKLNIKNNLGETICFSSCYPYFLEKKDTTWQIYEYVVCPELNLVEKCMKFGETKGFELSLNGAKNGLHRISVPVCVGCREGNLFLEDKRFYSNIFEIK